MILADSFQTALPKIPFPLFYAVTSYFTVGKNIPNPLLDICLFSTIILKMLFYVYFFFGKFFD